MSSTAVLGAGGVGGFVVAALTRAGEEVVVVARPPTAAVIADRGLEVHSVALGDFSARPVAVTELARDADVLFIATKATGLQTALERITGTPRLVVPLLNGLEHLQVLRHRFGAERVAAAVIRVESDRPAPGVIAQTSPAARIDMAASEPALSPALDALAARLRAAGIDARIGDSEGQVMWSKLARLCALALTTSAADSPIGYVRSDPRWRSALEGAINEAIAVANADGAALDAADTLAELDGAHAELGSSMQRDIAAGRPTELDAIAGAVIRAGTRHGLRCPTVQWLAERVALRARAAGAT
ncbi:MAG: 2-dehydropantoate 2-reductase [Solirubrobacteraceae bacterium]